MRQLNHNAAIMLTLLLALLLTPGCVGKWSTSDKTLKAIDTDNPETKVFAQERAAAAPGEYGISQATAIYTSLLDEWRIVNDPRGTEHIAAASYSIANGLVGDYDDFAVLFATIIESIGGKTRISFAESEGGKTHVFTELHFDLTPGEAMDLLNGKDQNLIQSLIMSRRVQELHYDLDEDGGIWLSYDYTTKFPGGAYYAFEKRLIVYPGEKNWDFQREFSPYIMKKN